MQALESLRAAVSGARAAVSGAAGSALHSLPIIGSLTAHDDTRHDVPHFPETGYVGGNAICAAAGKRMEDYLSKRTTKASALRASMMHARGRARCAHLASRERQDCSGRLLAASQRRAARGACAHLGGEPRQGSRATRGAQASSVVALTQRSSNRRTCVRW